LQIVITKTIMAKPLFFCLFTLIFIFSKAQNTIVHDTILTQYDFWIGEWEAAWDEEEGIKQYGTNSIARILGDKVLEENFKIHSGKNKGFVGQSYSVYHVPSGTWKQAWVDNQGGYFDFTGSNYGDRVYFSTSPVQKKKDVIIQRMVFYDIQDDSFTWDWELSKDGGDTWSLQWRIFYTRI